MATSSSAARASSPRFSTDCSTVDSWQSSVHREAGSRRLFARASGLRLEPGLVDAMLADVEGEPGALPLLSHALYESWTRRDGRVLTLAGYRAAGGVRGAIAHTAEEVYRSCNEEEQLLMRRM